MKPYEYKYFCIFISSILYLSLRSIGLIAYLSASLTTIIVVNALVPERTLAQTFRQRYNAEGILGIQKLIDESFILDEFDPEFLVGSAIAAAGETNPAMAAGILNALIGGCIPMEQIRHDRSQLALELLKHYDNSILDPDLVTLCLCFTALSSTRGCHNNQTRAILKRAIDLHPPSSKTGILEENNIPQYALGRKPRIPKDFGISVLKDQNDFCVIAKPSGMPVSSSKSSIASVETYLIRVGIKNLSNLNPDGSRGLVHRLDAGTSGCLVIAKTDSMHARMLSMFFLRRVHKTYTALVLEDPNKPLQQSGTISIPVQGRPAVTTYSVLERHGRNIVRLGISTSQGRKHQVRIHCARGLGAPILLDPLYGGEKVMFTIKDDILKRLRAEQKFCLHAETLKLPDFNIDAIAETPDWWDDILRLVERHDL